MINRDRWITFVLCLAGLWLSLLGFGSSLKDGKVVVGGDYVLSAGETLSGDLVMIGGHAVLEENAVVQRNVALIGSSLESSGVVQGDVVSLGSRIDLKSNAKVTGKVMLYGSNLNRASDAQVGEVVQLEPTKPLMGTAPSFSNETRFNWFTMGIGRWFVFLFKVFAWSALAVLIGLLFPHALERVADAVSSEVGIALGIGFLTWMVSIIGLIFLTITLIFIPVAFVAGLIVVAAWFYGMIAVGTVVGKRLAYQLHQDWSLPICAAVGTFGLIFITDGIAELIPCVGWVVPFLFGLLGLGSVVMTRFGNEAVAQKSIAQPLQ
ncbi:MAG: hypothetical protein ACPL3P_02560 [Anaerolineales bacterium]